MQSSHLSKSSTCIGKYFEGEIVLILFHSDYSSLWCFSIQSSGSVWSLITVLSLVNFSNLFSDLFFPRERNYQLTGGERLVSHNSFISEYYVWMLHVAKVNYFFSPFLLNSIRQSDRDKICWFVHFFSICTNSSSIDLRGSCALSRFATNL